MSKNTKIDKVVDGLNKHYTYIELNKRKKLAYEIGDYLSVIHYSYAMIEDRLLSFLHYLYITNKNHLLSLINTKDLRSDTSKLKEWLDYRNEYTHSIYNKDILSADYHIK